MLIAYEFSKEEIVLSALGSHENFYRDLITGHQVAA